MRYFVEISYNGKNYCGWQRQPHQLSVQQVLEEKMSQLLRQEIKLTGAGRTDAGVHAKQLFAHFDHQEEIDVERFLFRMNSFLPADIAVQNLWHVHDDAHARFDAVEREYIYVVSLGKNPFLEDFGYQLYRKPNIDLMNEAAARLLEHEDFECFSRSRTDVKTYICKIKSAKWHQENDTLIFTINADRFLRNMVRAIVGTLLDIGFKKTTLSQFEEILQSKDRCEAGPSAPAHGLYLNKISYPARVFKTDLQKEKDNINFSS